MDKTTWLLLLTALLVIIGLITSWSDVISLGSYFKNLIISILTAQLPLWIWGIVWIITGITN